MTRTVCALALLLSASAWMLTQDRDLTSSEVLSECAGMDIYLPKASPVGVAMYVHSGSWTHGDRRGDAAMFPVAARLLDAGWAVASIDYSFAAWPAPLGDAVCAATYLRQRFGRVVAWGGSAGGHIVSMLAVQSRAVSAAVNLSGPVDLTDPEWIAPDGKAMFSDQQAASPIAWRDAGDPPLLVIVGDRDPLVPVAQVAGSGFEYLIVAGGDHALNVAGMQPSRNELEARVVAFLTGR